MSAIFFYPILIILLGAISYNLYLKRQIILRETITPSWWIAQVLTLLILLFVGRGLRMDPKAYLLLGLFMIYSLSMAGCKGVSKDGFFVLQGITFTIKKLPYQHVDRIVVDRLPDQSLLSLLIPDQQVYHQQKYKLSDEHTLLSLLDSNQLLYDFKK